MVCVCVCACVCAWVHRHAQQENGRWSGMLPNAWTSTSSPARVMSGALVSPCGKPFLMEENHTRYNLYSTRKTYNHNIVKCLYCIINWVVRALNADWLKSVVYQTAYHGYDKTYTNIPRLRAVLTHNATLSAWTQALAVVYWPYTTIPRGVLLSL